MRQELKIKPKHWLMALGALMCAFVMALMLIFVIGLLKPYEKFFIDYFYHIIGSILCVILIGYMFYRIAECFAKWEVDKGKGGAK